MDNRKDLENIIVSAAKRNMTSFGQNIEKIMASKLINKIDEKKKEVAKGLFETTISEETVTCPTCNGSGKITMRKPHGPVEATCPMCGGSGKVNKGNNGDDIIV